MTSKFHRTDISRRQFIGGATAALALSSAGLGQVAGDQRGLAFINGRIHTMDASNRVVAQALMRNGRFVAVGDNVTRPPGEWTTVDLMGKTVIPGIIDAHNHVVLVGNRPGWHTPLEHASTIPEAIALLKARATGVPGNEFITIVGPVTAMQFRENRLPTLEELDTIDRPVYIQAAQGGTRINSQARMWFESHGLMTPATGVLAGGGFAGGASGSALQLLRKEFLNAETRQRTALGALEYYAMLGITTHRDEGAFHSDGPSNNVAAENTYTMHEPFLALNRAGRMPARLRIDFLHQDAANANPPLPTLSERLRNSFPFFGDEWLKTGGIGEFTGGGVDGLRAIARAGWRAEDHALNLAGATQLITARETVNAEIPIKDLRWIISHIPNFTPDLANRANAMGMGVLVGWGPTRTGSNVGPPYRMLMEHPIHKGYHSDGGDITVINPWLNFYTMITGKNLTGQQILGDQTLTRQETLWLATAANKWFIEEDDLGSIETGNHADMVVLDRDFFTIPEEEIRQIRSLLTIVGGKVVHNSGVL
ncbi:MAG TPA: amidohydrolase family protein [Terriglobia bacterium]|nr:amidohydrolase family protein [Terriglobia bacterium]